MQKPALIIKRLRLANRIDKKSKFSNKSLTLKKHCLRHNGLELALRLRIMQFCADNRLFCITLYIFPDPHKSHAEYTHMGQFLQGENFGCFVSLFV